MHVGGYLGHIVKSQQVNTASSRACGGRPVMCALSNLRILHMSGLLEAQFQTPHIIWLVVVFNPSGRVSFGFLATHVSSFVSVAFREEYLYAPIGPDLHVHPCSHLLTEELFFGQGSSPWRCQPPNTTVLRSSPPDASPSVSLFISAPARHNDNL